MASKYDFNPKLHQAQLVPLLTKLSTSDVLNKSITPLLKRYPKSGVGFFTKNELIKAYQYYQPKLKLPLSIAKFSHLLQKKPTRSLSGVAVVTTLTKPFPCPGKCIFCPSDIRMPKSYLADEPGAQRAAKNAFDPYLQTYNRLQALSDNGHDTSKIELIILGGTWSYYPEPYQLWYITRSFQALNDFGASADHRDQVILGNDFQHPKTSINGARLTKTYNQLISEELIKHHHKQSTSQPKTLNHWEHATWDDLQAAQKINETNTCRCVGLVLETRPDNISTEEVIKLRHLGATKTQIGIQSLSDRVLHLNHRGHTVAATRHAFRLLRQAGFKIHAHWMPNLYGSNPDHDIKDYQKLFTDPDFMPDELKIYPCSLISSAELMQYYNDGRWKPYTYDDLLRVLTECIKLTPAYCRLTRVIRDIPGTDIVTGNKATNFRQIAEDELVKQGVKSVDIRAREIKSDKFEVDKLKLEIISYQTSASSEKFLQFVTPDNQILAFLRLSLPTIKGHSGAYPLPSGVAIESSTGRSYPPSQSFGGTVRSRTSSRMTLSEIEESAIIREIHVYGPAVRVGDKSKGKPQHLGLGKKLIKRAIEISKNESYKNLAVISAVGTREYYRKLGFKDGDLYQHYELK